ncbi:diguanylate cyclase [Metabacillus sp. 84]|uniref:sensor domain-containing diguanylate cyclase n=1 Tax=Metabacillus sp. 84 TaxID=3404705 RepID=UPI003CEC8D3F
MSPELTVSITLICTSAVLNLYLCLYVYLKRKHYTSMAAVFILHSFFSLIYCIGSVFVLMSSTLGEIKFWTAVLYAGLPFSAAMGLLFVMKYLGIHLSKKVSLSLMLVPLITLVMVVTNDSHHFHYRVYELDPVLGAPYVHQEIGVWYIINGLYTFASMLVAFLLVLSRWRETAASYRPQLLSLLVGQLIPMVTAFLYLLGLTPRGIDPVPMVLWLTSLFYLWSVTTSRMFTLMPIAKDVIFNSINDGVMVLDESRRIVEYNAACQNMFPLLDMSMFGKSFAEVWEIFSNGADRFDLERNSVQREVQIHGSGEMVSTYQVRTSKVRDASNREGILLIFTDFTELKQLQSRLEHFAYYDELTGLYNRRAFFEQGEAAFEAAQQQAVPYTVILADIDYFKSINDTYGHAIGDQVLEHVAAVLREQLNGRGLLARYGGEEFVLGLAGITETEGAALAEELRSRLDGQPLQTAEGLISPTASFGVAHADFSETLYQLLNQADKALYAAKEAGRNRVSCAVPLSIK